MEINVTKLVNEVDCFAFAASIHESGLQDIGQRTWQAAIDYIEENGLLTEDRERLISYFREFGAWELEVLQSHTDVELSALLLQFIAGDIREYESYEDYDAYVEASEQGTAGGRLYRTGLNPTAEWFYYVGM